VIDIVNINRNKINENDKISRNTDIIILIKNAVFENPLKKNMNLRNNMILKML